MTAQARPSQMLIISLSSLINIISFDQWKHAVFLQNVIDQLSTFLRPVSALLAVLLTLLVFERKYLALRVSLTHKCLIEHPLAMNLVLNPNGLQELIEGYS